MTPPQFEWTCPTCGFLVDTPNHELGCPVGRATFEAAEEAVKKRYGIVKLDSDGYEEGGVGYWHRRYDEQHRTLHRLEDELRELRESFVPLDQHQRAIENVIQLDTLRRSEEERADLKQQLRILQVRYDELSEQTGSALARAHIMRGDRELDAAKLAEELDLTRVALWQALWALRSE